MTMTWEVSFTFSNPLYHSESDVKDAIKEAIASDPLNEIDNLNVKLEVK